MVPSSLSSPSLSPRHLHSNASAIDEMKELQERTLEALNRAEGQLETTRAVANDTHAELKKQTGTLEKIRTSDVSRLGENLNTGRKQLNRFARGALRIGTRHRAKQQRKKDEKRNQPQKQQEQKQQQKEKKRTKAAPKKTDAASVPAHQNRRQLLLFEKKKTRKDAAGDSARSATNEDTLDDEHRRELNDIEATDARIDTRIDALGDGVANLLAMASAMGDEVDHQNCSGLEPLLADLEKCETKMDVNSRQLKRLNR